MWDGDPVWVCPAPPTNPGVGHRGGAPDVGGVSEVTAGESRRTRIGGIMATLTRPQHGAVIAGVCAGLAERFGMSAGVVRLLFVLSCLLPGPQILLYVALWIILPSQ
jgi:phage shock protein PspC (stress-responsive transcriptional regulator)